MNINTQGTKISGYKTKTYFDGKNMEDEDTKDFKLQKSFLIKKNISIDILFFFDHTY